MKECWCGGKCRKHCPWCGKKTHDRADCADRITYVAEREIIERARPISETLLSDQRCSNGEYTRRYRAGTLKSQREG